MWQKTRKEGESCTSCAGGKETKIDRKRKGKDRYTVYIKTHGGYPERKSLI